MRIKQWTQCLVMACALLTTPCIPLAFAGSAIIKIDCCKPGGCYIIAARRFGKRPQAKVFDSKEEARAFIKKQLSPRLKHMHPRVVEVSPNP